MSESDYLNKTIDDANHNILYLDNILQNDQLQSGIYIKKQIEYFNSVIFYHSLLQKSENIDGNFITLVLKTLLKLKTILLEIISFDEKPITKNTKEMFLESLNVYETQYNMLLLTALK